MIPVRNLYYLLLYAWDVLKARDVVDVQTLDPNEEVVGLLARVLRSGTTALLRRGLDRGYGERAEVLPGIRGRLDIETSLKRALFPQALAACRFDELSHDVAHNRVIRATLRRLATAPELPRSLRGDLAGLYRRFEGVVDIPLRSSAFRGIRLHRNNHHYGLVLAVCRLVCEGSLVGEDGTQRFQDFRRDPARMRTLFEHFVRNFFARHAEGYRVSAPSFGWVGADASPSGTELLPGMRTDIVLEAPERTLVVDTKYTQKTLATGRHRKHVKTGHLYQLHAYMTNMAASGRYPGPVEGLLLYPETEGPVALDYRLQGRRVRVSTVNLDQPWQGIEAALLALVA